MTFRREEIAGGLIAASDSEIDFMLSSLFMAFPTGAAPQIGVYRAALRGMPAWAIRLACSAWITGKGGGNLAFAPSAPQLRAEAEGRVIPLRIEAADIGKILGAEVVREPSPEERERVLAKFSKLSADLAAAKSIQAASEPPKRHPWLERRDAARLAPLPIEDALMHEHEERA